jgi:hypothetical protein
MEIENKRTVTMPYIGGVLSINSYKVRGRGGLATNKTKDIVVMWMKVLEEKVNDFYPGRELDVIVSGFFTDGRYPDMDNLSKVILDAIKKGTGLDDRYMRYIPGEVHLGYAKPYLEITLQRRLFLS